MKHLYMYSVFCIIMFCHMRLYAPVSGGENMWQLAHRACVMANLVNSKVDEIAISTDQTLGDFSTILNASFNGLISFIAQAKNADNTIFKDFEQVLCKKIDQVDKNIEEYEYAVSDQFTSGFDNCLVRIGKEIEDVHSSIDGAQSSIVDLIHEQYSDVKEDILSMEDKVCSKVDVFDEKIHMLSLNSDIQITVDAIQEAVDICVRQGYDVDTKIEKVDEHINVVSSDIKDVKNNVSSLDDVIAQLSLDIVDVDTSVSAVTITTQAIQDRLRLLTSSSLDGLSGVALSIESVCDKVLGTMTEVDELSTEVSQKTSALDIAVNLAKDAVISIVCNEINTVEVLVQSKAEIIHDGIDDLTYTVNHSGSITEQLAHDITDLDNAITTVQETVDTFDTNNTQRFHSLYDHVSQVMSDVSYATSVLEDVDDDLHIVTTDMCSKINELSTITRENNTIIQTLSSKVDFVDAGIDSVQSDVHDIRNNVVAVQSAVASSTDNISDIALNLNSVHQKVSDVLVQGEELDATLTSAKNEVISVATITAGVIKSSIDSIDGHIDQLLLDATGIHDDLTHGLSDITSSFESISEAVIANVVDGNRYTVDILEHVSVLDDIVYDVKDELNTSIAGVQNTANTINLIANMMHGKIDVFDSKVDVVDGNIDQLSLDVANVDSDVATVQATANAINLKVSGLTAGLGDVLLISSAPFTTSRSGVYLLTNDVTTASGDAITIAHDNVIIQLNGHTVRALSGNGIVASGRSGILVSDGAIKDSDLGIYLYNVD